MGSNHGKNRRGNMQPRVGVDIRETKQPHVAVAPGERKPRTAVPPASDEKTVVWQFHHIDDLFAGWKKDVEMHDLHQFIGRLQHLERVGWEGIGKQANRRGGDHLIPPSRLCSKAQARLIDLQLEEHDALLSIRITGKKRAWAVRVGTTAIARMLWWDPDHKVYPVEKKNT